MEASVSQEQRSKSGARARAAVGHRQSGVGRRWAAVMVGVAALAGGDASVSAQDVAGGAGRGEAAATAVDPGLRPGDRSKRAIPESPQQQQQEAEELLVAIEQASQSMSRDLQAARRERDVVRVLCLNDKLTQVNVASRSAGDRFDSLRTAVEMNDKERSRHEFTVLQVLSDRVRVLGAEANQCVGEETGFAGEAEVSVTIDPNMPDNDPERASGFSEVSPPPTVNSPIE